MRWIVRRPRAFVPAPSDNPLAWLGGADAHAHARSSFFRRGHAFQIQFQETFPKAQQVRMSVNQSRQRGPAMEILKLRSQSVTPMPVSRRAHPDHATVT